MADRPTFKPLALSEQEILTVALPDKAPGRADDAQTAILKDSDLQSTDQWSAIAERLDSGGLDAAIAQEEAQFRPQQQNRQDQEPRLLVDRLMHAAPRKPNARDRLGAAAQKIEASSAHTRPRRLWAT